MQAAHAAIGFIYAHPEIAGEWHGSSNTLAVLAARDELALWQLAEALQRRGLSHTPFYEPDLGHALTAVAAEPAAAPLMRRYPLALYQKSGRTP